MANAGQGHDNLPPGQMDQLFKILSQPDSTSAPAPAPKVRVPRPRPWRMGMVAAGRGPRA